MNLDYVPMGQGIALMFALVILIAIISFRQNILKAVMALVKVIIKK